jgi:hypothetical protein
LYLLAQPAPLAHAARSRFGMAPLGAAAIVQRQMGSWKGVVVVLQQGQVFKLTSMDAQGAPL